MGCDIHSVGQIKKDGKWESVIGRPGGDDRNYDSFAVLADVRNGSGFAGCDTGEGWEVLFPARGLPKDIGEFTEELKVTEPHYWSFDKEKKDPEYDIWLGDHSHSWLTLEELHKIQDHFKGKYYEKHGMLTEEQNAELEKGKLPESWCGGTTQAGYVTAKWKRPASDCLWTLGEMIKALDDLKNKHNLKPDEVRVVFGFDS